MLRQLFVITMVACAGAVQAAENSSGLSDYQRESGQLMLKQVKRDIEEHHYDASWKGPKLNAVVDAASARIAQARSNAEVFRAIASVTRSLNDSHTQFLPPRWGFSFNYGWRVMPAGKNCIVHRVTKGSDAERKGVKVGDQLLGLNGVALTADTLPAWEYLLEVIEPLQSARLTLVSPGGEPREVEVLTEVKERQRNFDVMRDYDVLMREREGRQERGRNIFREFDDVLVWRLKHFTSDTEITEGLRKIQGHAKLVLDLRGNPGGLVSEVRRVAAVLLGRDTKIGMKKTRDREEPVIAELRREKPWTGKLMVLIDRKSGSGAEIVAAAVQQSGRGLLLGDRTAGAVQEGRVTASKVGVDRLVFYGTIVATSEFRLADGRKIEGVGVTPDFMMPLSGGDIAARRDPVLSRALKQLGVMRAPEELADVCWIYDAPEPD